jgi:hypothetical protein
MSSAWASELHVAQARIDHPVHGVDAATANSDDLDDREIAGLWGEGHESVRY